MGVGAVAAAGLGLSCFYLLERPIRGTARWASWAHGVVGASGVGAFVWGWWRAPDASGFGRLAGWLLVSGLVAGVLIAAYQLLRRRRPAGLVVALHATLGVVGMVILLAYVSIGR